MPLNLLRLNISTVISKVQLYTDKKKSKFSSYIRKFRTGTVPKSYMRKGFLIVEEMRKYLVIFEDVLSQIYDFAFCNRSRLNFLTYEENLISFFISVVKKITGSNSSSWSM
jgi:hypothetical protein